MLRFLQAGVDIEQHASEIRIRVRNRRELFGVIILVLQFLYFLYRTKTTVTDPLATNWMILMALFAVILLSRREQIRFDREHLFHRSTIAGVGILKRYRLQDIRGLRVEEGPPPMHGGRQGTFVGGYPRIWFDELEGIVKIGRGLSVEDAHTTVQAMCAFQPRLCAGYVPTKPGVVLTLGL